MEWELPKNLKPLKPDDSWRFGAEQGDRTTMLRAAASSRRTTILSLGGHISTALTEAAHHPSESAARSDACKSFSQQVAGRGIE